MGVVFVLRNSLILYYYIAFQYRTREIILGSYIRSYIDLENITSKMTKTRYKIGQERDHFSLIII